MAYPFKLPDLPYAFDALEPHIDARTMEIHHDKHHKAYTDKLNAAIEKHPDWQKKSISDILRAIDKVPEDIRGAVRNNGGGYVVDELALRHKAGVEEETSDAAVAYARFHGRNYEKWFAHEESWERYNYLYSPEELAPWVDRIRRMANESETYVITNNHFRGQAVVNAAELKRALGQEGRVPPQVKETYPDRA